VNIADATPGFKCHLKVAFRLSSSSIDEVSLRVLGSSRLEASSMDPFKCQTSTATPAEPGGLSLTLERPGAGGGRGRSRRGFPDKTWKARAAVDVCRYGMFQGGCQTARLTVRAPIEQPT
jgi:hypothetical protein